MFKTQLKTYHKGYRGDIMTCMLKRCNVEYTVNVCPQAKQNFQGADPWFLKINQYDSEQRVLCSFSDCYGYLIKVAV